MAIRERLLSRYLGEEEIYDSIWHDFLRFLRIFVVYALFLWVLWLLWYLTTTHVYKNDLVNYGFAIAWVVIYVKWIIEILDAYLDALLITSMGLVLFRRDGLFRQKVVNLQWVAIETVIHEQNTLWDKLFNKWDITIFVEDEQYSFRNAASPRWSVVKILERKDKILGRFRFVEENQEQVEDRSKYELLVEALGEVVTEYVEKKNTT